MIKDMTKGHPSKILFYFALPMIIGNLFQQFYNIADSIIIGNFVGSDALAAIGVSYPVTFICITIANGASIGCGVVISQYFGRNDIGKMKSSIYTSIISVGILSSIIMLTGIVFVKDILIFMNTPNNIMDDGMGYLRIYFMGTVFLFIYNICNAAFNALGNSKTPLIFLVGSSFINIILDLILVIRYDMGVRGAAYGTLISQGMASILSFLYLIIKLKDIKNKENLCIFNFDILKLISKIAFPSMIQQSIVSIGNLLVQTLVNSFGSVIIAGYTAAIKIDSIAILPMVSMSNALSTFTAQNIGAGKNERVKSGYKSAIGIIACFCAFIAFILCIYGKSIIGIFVDNTGNEGVISIGVRYIRTVSLCYFLMGLMVNTNGILRASGDMKFFLGSTIINLGMRVFCAYFISWCLGVSGIWYAVPCGWVCSSVFSVLRYKSGKWKEKKVI